MKARWAIFILGPVLAASNWQPARAQEAVGMGAGTQTCAEFADFSKSDPALAERVFYAWAQGFLSGLNLGNQNSGHARRDLAASDTDSQKLFLRQYCADNPLKTYTQGILALYLTLPELKE